LEIRSKQPWPEVVEAIEEPAVMKTAVGIVALSTVILALLGTSAHGEPPPRKLISLTGVAPDVTPVSDYTGDFWNRSTMFGDPGGVRRDLYEKGFSLDVDLTQVVQGLVSGGVDENAWGYNGLLDYSAWLDTGKLGLWSGGLLAVRAETSWFHNTSFNSDVGNVSPASFIAMLPVPFEPSTVLMEYYLSQAFPKDIVLVAGRLNLHNFLDTNRFANDPKNQFLNFSLGNNFVWGYFFSFTTYAAILAAPLPRAFRSPWPLGPRNPSPRTTVETGTVSEPVSRLLPSGSSSMTSVAWRP
jgi:hypothetical protein